MPDTAPKQRTAVKVTGQTFTEPQSRLTVGWTPAKIKLAEAQADSGNLTLAADLIVAMLGDERLRGVTETLGGVCSLPMVFESGSRGVENDQDPAAKALSDGDWWDILPEETQAEIVVWGRLLGVTVCNISEWRVDDETGRALPTVNVWSPRWARWDEKEQLWEIATREGRVWTDGADGTWLILTAYRETKGWQAAPWRGLALLWMLKACSVIDWADYGDKHAQAKRVLSRSDYTTGADGDLVVGQLSEEDGKRLVRDIHALGRSGTIRVPDGYALDLLESMARSDQTYRDQIELANVAYAVTLLGQNLTTEVQAGAYASTSVHYLVQGDRIRTIAEWLSTGYHKKLLPWWRQYNFGDTVKTPWARYDTTPPTDRKAEAERFGVLASGMQSLQSSSIEIDVTIMSEHYGLPEGMLTKSQQETSPTPQPFGFVERSAIAAADERASQDQLDSGQDYIDDLQGAGVVKVSRALRPHVDELVALVKAAGAETATTEEQRVAALRKLRAAVLAQYDGMDPALFANTVERVEMLASMAGGYSAVET